MGELTKRVVVAVFGIPLLIGATYMGGWYFFVIAAIISVVAQWEFYKIQRQNKIYPQNISGIIMGLIILLGVHTGEIDLVGDDIGGTAIHLAARAMAMAGADEVWVSSTVKDLVAGSGITFGGRRVHSLKGIPGEWQLFTVDQ